MRKDVFKLYNGIYAPVIVVTKSIEEEEARVVSLLMEHKKLRVGQIVAGIKGLGAHEIHETARKNTTTRKIYQIIRNLREAHYPIVGDTNGVWIAQHVHEVKSFADHLEEKARSDIKSMLHLKRTLLSSIQCEASSLFDGIQHIV